MTYSSPLRFLQITDTHLFADENQKFNGITTFKSLKSIINHVKRLFPQPDFLLFTGDIAEKGEEEAYLLFDGLIKDLPMPSYWLPGNHDNPILMEKLVESLHVLADKYFSFDGINFITLNSVITGESHGLLSSEELVFLEEYLDNNKDKPCIVAVHHNPIATGTSWSDEMMLQNHEEFINLIGKHNHVSAVLFGHIHHIIEKKIGKTWYLSTPSTAFNVKLGKGIEEFELDMRPIGYRIIDIDTNGAFLTEVRPVFHAERAKIDKEYES